MKTLKEIGWWTLSLVGAFIFIAFLAPPADNPMLSLAFPFIATFGFCICAGASQNTSLGKRIMAKDNNNK